MSAVVFDFDPVKADQVTGNEAAQLLAVLRWPSEDPWLQTFADGPSELYAQEAWTDRYGQPRVTEKFCVKGLSSKGKRLTAAVSQYGSHSLADLTATRPYSVQNSSARVGVFFAVNTIDSEAKRRGNDTVRRAAAVFLDLDGKPLPVDGFPLPPTAIVESSPGRWHVYWAVSDLPLQEFTPAQKHLAKLYGGDDKVSDLARVMRLPGYWHGKTEAGFLSRLESLNPDSQYTRADLMGFPGLREALELAERQAAELLQKAAESQARAVALRAEVSSGTVTDRTEALQKYGQAALLDELGILTSTGQGGRNSQLFKSAAALGECVAAGVLEQADVEAELRVAAQAIGLGEHETETTLRSGMSTGLKKPRDLSKVGQLVGKKKAKSSGNLTAAAARIEPEAASTITADQIPDPEGEGGSYSDEQLRELLNLTWPVVGIDTDKAHSYRLKDLAGEDLGFVAELGGYVAWNGRQWLSGGKDGAGQVEAKRRVQGLGVYMRPEVDQLLNLYSILDRDAVKKRQEKEDSSEAKAARHKADAMEKAYYNHGRAARATEADGKQKAILSSARTLYVKSILLFEPKPWVVGFQNGTWDHGTFRPAQREDHLLALAAVQYQPDANRHDWLEVLERITGGDADLAHTLQDVAGYALSGASSLRLLPWLYGEAGTGKSTFSELLATVLGDMAATVDPKLFAVDAARERLGAAIWGKRVALCAEAGNARLDAEALKTLSGGDRLSVRMLYAEGFSARASHVLVMVANDAPRVEAYDEALKDRVLALPFNHPLKAGAPLLDGRRIEELRQDPASDLVRGFTAWAVEGLARVHRLGNVHRAAASQAATRGFWENVDPLHDFWLEQDFSELIMGIPVSEFRGRYETWCAESGRGRTLGAQKFNKACLSVGLEQFKGTGGKRLIKLLEPTKYPVGSDFSGKSGDFDPNSLKPNFSSYTREREKGFTENSPKVAIVATPSENTTLAPVSGEL